MSKRLKNYPDPVHVVNEFGADALRLYLINSPVVRAESLKFKEQGVRDILKDVFLPWFNAYRFFVEVVHKYNKVKTINYFIFNMCNCVCRKRVSPSSPILLLHWL